MAYKYDKDLEFLRNMNDKSLNDLVRFLTNDKDGNGRWTEELTSNELYKKHYPNHGEYLDLILEEFQRFGGNTLINLVRRGGVSYKEILCDVADKMKVNYNKKSDVEQIEDCLFMKILDTSFDKMSQDDIKNISNDLKLDLNTYTKEAIMFSMQNLIKMGGFKSYQIALIVANTVAKAILGSGLALATNAAISRTIGIFAGPIGWAVTGAWTAADIAGPAFRVTIPCVVQIAFLRKKYNEETKNIEEEKKKKEEKMKDLELEKEKKYSIKELFNQRLSILMVGATGSGKSSTINALFENENKEPIAKIGTDYNPETKTIKSYNVGGNLTIYDTPGLGDGKDDEKYKKLIKEKLEEKDENGEALIDIVLVVVNSSTRDLGTTYRLIEEDIIPNISKDRILVAFNKCDKASDNPSLKFDYEKNEPNEALIEYLDKGVDSLRKRIFDTTGVDIDVIYYASGYTDENGVKTQKAYNLNKLLSYLLKHTPLKKRLVYLKYKSGNQDDFSSNDNKEDYNKSIFDSIFGTIKKYVKKVINTINELIDFSKTDDGKKIFENGKELYDLFSSFLKKR